METNSYGDFIAWVKEFFIPRDFLFINAGEGVVRDSNVYVYLTVSSEDGYLMGEEELAFIKGIVVATPPNLKLTIDYWWTSISIKLSYLGHEEAKEWYGMEKFENKFDEWYTNVGLKLIDQARQDFFKGE